MTRDIKPKQCGEHTWYIPNQNGFVPKLWAWYWFCGSNGEAYKTQNYNAYDYAMIEDGNCFETVQEALDAFVKPVDPTPITWDELCEMEAAGGYPYCISPIRTFSEDTLGYVFDVGFASERADVIRKQGRILFEANKWWRSKESLQAWIEQQKGE